VGAPLYLFTGPEAGEQNDAIAALKERLKKTAGTLDEYSLYAGEDGIGNALSLLENESLFASARFMVIRNAELIKKKEDIHMIAQWAKGAGQGMSTLALVSSETKVDKKLENCVPQENRKVFWELFSDQKERWLRNFFRKNGCNIEDGAIETILELIENNTEALRTECSRFFLCFEKGHTITGEDAEKVLSHNREESAFTLFDALAEPARSKAARLESAGEILGQILGAKDGGAVKLIAGLTWCFRRLLDWHTLIADKGSPSDFDLKTAGFGNPKAKTQYRNAAKLWNPEETLTALSLLAVADADIRTGLSGLEEVMLDMLLFSLIEKRDCLRVLPHFDAA
jgi:DNA polymerase-3 subunit delta